MKSRYWKPIVSVALLAGWLMVACTDHKPQTSRRDTLAGAAAKGASDAPYHAVNTWLDDFINFRTAVYQKDVARMKTYFTFPVLADTTQIWEAVYAYADDDRRPQTYPETFTAADLEKHYQQLFTGAFTQSLLKVKSKPLYENGEYTTPEINANGQRYHMIANYDQATATLQLSLVYADGTDEHGEEMSESESAIIYFFKVENNKNLKFDKVLFAG